jgi:uncharacterized membrane protein
LLGEIRKRGFDRDVKTMDILGIIGGVITAGVAVIAFFIKRELTKHDKDLEDLRGENKGLREFIDKELKEKSVAIDKLREDYNTKIEKADDRLLKARDTSQHDIDLSNDKAFKQISDLRERVDSEVRNLERMIYDLRTQSNERFVLKIEFIRETAILDTHIANTKRTLDNLDSVLGEYLKKG